MAPKGAGRVVSTAAMAFILVLKLLISKACPFMLCQIVLLHVQSKARPGMAALQWTHGLRHDFFIIYRMFCVRSADIVAFLRRLVAFCRCIIAGQPFRRM
jgi:hypothetical protein